MTKRDYVAAFLIGSALLAPVTAYWASRLSARSASEPYTDAARFWLYFLTFVLGVRLVAGVMIVAGLNPQEVSYFYPIRIAWPNWNVLQGVPYVAFCLLVLAYLPKLSGFIERSRWRYFLLWGFAAALLVAFGAIHGGLIEGNIGVSNAAGHLNDARLNATVWDTLATHVDRIAGKISPPYEAPHSTSHPAFAIVYWQWLALPTSPFVFSIINVLLFSLSFPIILWALRRRFDLGVAMQGTLASLLIPGLLIYGRSDDAIYYALAGVMTVVLWVAVSESRFVLTAVSGLLAGIAMNMSYAAVILLPAAFSFNANVPLKQLPQYLRRVIPHIFVVLAVCAVMIYLVARLTEFNLLAAFKTSVEFNRATHLMAVLGRGLFADALNQRLMAWADFPIFAGPLLLYLCVRLAQGWSPNVLTWQLNNIALAVLLIVLAVNSSGAGELARPWGSIYLLAAIAWLPGFLQPFSEDTRWWLIRAQFGWAISLQTVLNFGW